MGRATLKGRLRISKRPQVQRDRSVAVVETGSSCENAHEECPKMREMKQIVSVERRRKEAEGKPKEIGKLDKYKGLGGGVVWLKSGSCAPRLKSRSGRSKDRSLHELAMTLFAA